MFGTIAGQMNSLTELGDHLVLKSVGFEFRMSELGSCPPLVISIVTVDS